MNQLDNINTFEQFFVTFYKPVLRYCMSMVKYKDDAEDIVQQVFVSLWHKRRSIFIRVSPRAYLYKSVYHASLDFLRHEKIKKKYGEELVAAQAYAGHLEATPEIDLEQKVEQAIERLPPACGRIFKMSRNDKLKYREIADSLGISEKTVEKQMVKALKLLRESLMPLFNDK